VDKGFQAGALVLLCVPGYRPVTSFKDTGVKHEVHIAYLTSDL
jgi:hypothetical protein